MSGRLYPSHPLLAVSIAVFREGRVLLATRTKPPAADVFSLPGGVLETGESLEAGALRELWEEVEVEAEIIGFNRHLEVIHRDEDARVRHHFVVVSFVGLWRTGEGTPGPEAGEILWADPDRLGDLRCTPNLLPVIASARAVLGRHLSAARV